MSDDMNLDLAPGWRPVVGEVLVGKVIDVSRGWSEQGEKYYPIITVQPEKPVTIANVAKDDGSGTARDDDFIQTDGPVAVHAFHTALYNRLVELRPEQNERIGVKYVSETQKPPKGSKKNTPAIYNVRIDGRTSDVWSAMAVDPRLAAAEATAAAVVAATDPNTPEAPDDDDIPF